ncbi:MAG: FHA domain-containing protein [Clostridia bacterium]|nr:FHA domain-containing protein [Clostridia bacterium]
MYKRILRTLIAAVLAMALLVPAALAVVTEKIAVTKVVQDPAGMWLYADLLDNRGNPSGDSFSEDKYTVEIDGVPYKSDEVTNFTAVGAGMHYVVCVDISGSIKNHEMDAIQAGVKQMVSVMGENDTMSLITFGTNVNKLMIQSADKSALTSSVDIFTRTDMKTQLYEAIYTAVAVGRTNPVNPYTRAIAVIITDGTEDANPDKVGEFTYENILDTVKKSCVPVSTVLVVHEGEEAADISSLEEFGHVSGGQVYRALPGEIMDKLTGIQLQAGNAVMVHVPLFNSVGATGLNRHELQMRLNIGGEELRSNAYAYELDWDVVPVPTPTPTPTPMPTPSPTPSPSPTPTPEPTPEPATPTPIPTMPPRATETPAADPLIFDPAVTEEPAPTEKPADGMLGFVQNIFGDSVKEEHLWIIIVGAVLLVLIIILIVVLISRGRRKSESYVDFENGDTMYMGRPDGGSDEGTVRQDLTGAEGYDGGTINRELFVAHEWEENAGEWNNDENATADTGVVWTEPAAEEPAHHTSTGTTRITVSGVTELTTDDANGTVRINMRRRGIVVNFEESRVDESTGSYIECPARSVTLEREIVVGRLGECDLMIDDMAVSGRHLKITREDGVMMVTDLHSSNGTELNGQRISRATNLNSGDMLTIGRTTLKVTFKN